jgi:flagellar hook-associated protein 3 FlgL
MVSISDLARNLMLQKTTASVKRDMNNAAQAVSTGLHADISRETRGDLGLLSSIGTSLARIEGWQANTTLLQVRLEVQQAALQGIDALATSLSTDMLVSSGAHSMSGLVAVGQQGLAGFATAIDMLNSIADGSYAFAGQNADRPPLLPADAILSELQTQISGLVFVQDIETAVNDWFNDAAGFSAFAYQGGDPRAAISVSESESIPGGVTAIDPGLLDTLSGLALGALLGQGVPAGPHEARFHLAQRVGERLVSAQVDRTDLAASVGIAEQRVAQARTRLGAEASAFGQARAEIVAADPYEAALRLEETQARLEAIFMLTARLSRLSLTEYLR